MKPRFIQASCREDNVIDLRQAKLISRYKPDIILLEYPGQKNKYNTIIDCSFNSKQSIKKIQSIQYRLRGMMKLVPWLKSEMKMLDNIIKLIKSGRRVEIYGIDGPKDLLIERYNLWKGQYPQIAKNWLWWVRIFLREKYMVKNIKSILKHYKLENNPNVAVFLQSFHWRHVKFLLKNYSEAKIWHYYFSKFGKYINSDNIASKIKTENDIFYKYWRIVSKF